jgi:cytochrome c oxidase cbb3-type subunit 3
MAQVASYVLTFQGTTPANPKEAEGDIWVDENAPKQEEAPAEQATDSVTVAINE